MIEQSQQVAASFWMVGKGGRIIGGSFKNRHSGESRNRGPQTEFCLTPHPGFFRGDDRLNVPTFSGRLMPSSRRKRMTK
jgi:hypothetical protein